MHVPALKTRRAGHHAPAAKHSPFGARGEPWMSGRRKGVDPAFNCPRNVAKQCGPKRSTSGRRRIKASGVHRGSPESVLPALRTARQLGSQCRMKFGGSLIRVWAGLLLTGSGIVRPPPISLPRHHGPMPQAPRSALPERANGIYRQLTGHRSVAPRHARHLAA